MFETRRAVAALAAFTLIGSAAQAQRAAPSGVRDGAKMFSPGAVAKADGQLDDLRKTTGWGVVIATVEGLDDKTPRDAAVAGAKAAGVHGLYVLLSKGDHKVFAEPSESARSVFDRDVAQAVDDAVVRAFKAKDYDRGLLDAVAVARKAAEAAPTPTRAAAEPDAAAAPQTAAERPAARTIPAPAAGSGLPTLLLLGGGVLVGLWLLSRLFRRPPTAAPDAGYTPAPNPGYQPQQPPARPGVGPGYAPQAGPGYGNPPPGPGYAPQAGPGYGPAGYGPPMQGGGGGGGGGGFVSGALGGAAGAVVGNILYDKFGHPHPAPQTEAGAFPHQAADPNADWPAAQAGPIPDDADRPATPVTPAENYDPNAGTGADWGGDDPAVAPDTTADWGTEDAGNEGWSAGNDDGGGGGGGDAGNDNQGGSW